MAARFSLRDVIWLLVVVALGFGWWLHVRHVRSDKTFEASEASDEREWMEKELGVAQHIAACADRLEITMIERTDREFRRYGPFVTNDDLLLAEIRRSLEDPDNLERNSFGHNRPVFGGPYLEITLVCTSRKDEYRLRLVAPLSIALGDQALYRVVREDSAIWQETLRVAQGAESMKWFDRD